MGGQAAAIARAAIAAALVLVVLLETACGGEPAPDEGFAIYLTATDTPLALNAALTDIEIADTPFVSGADIVAYSADTHEIELTAAAYSRIVALEVPVSGRPFVVCVDHRPIYAGAFWTPISSVSFGGVMIMKPLSPETASNRHAIRLEPGYPGPDFSTGDDPRSDPAVLEALERAGKLRGAPYSSTTSRSPGKAQSIPT
jgi:hypothetical protein